jgi:hypothetical protein
VAGLGDGDILQTKADLVGVLDECPHSDRSSDEEVELGG